MKKMYLEMRYVCSVRIKLIFIFTALLCPLLSVAQTTEGLLKSYFSEVRTGNYPPIPKPLSLPENAKTTLATLKIYLNDTVVDVRSKAYTLLHVVGDNSRVPDVRQQAVTKLIEACKDKDSGNVGLALDYLTKYFQSDFTLTSRDSIRSLFKRKISHFDQLLRIVGFLSLTDLTDDILPLTKPGTSQSVRWAAIVSLSRMGNFEAANEMMRRVKKLPVNDDVIYKIFPDLAYSRNPEAINYMIEGMKSDEKNCLSADAEKEEPIACGYRIMEQLAPVIEKYPLTLDSSGDIEAKDYTVALQTVREWFTKHPDFKIRQDNF